MIYSKDGFYLTLITGIILFLSSIFPTILRIFHVSMNILELSSYLIKINLLISLKYLSMVLYKIFSINLVDFYRTLTMTDSILGIVGITGIILIVLSFLSRRYASNLIPILIIIVGFFILIFLNFYLAIICLIGGILLLRKGLFNLS